VTAEPFVDYYDLLQLSPNADEETIHRVFRHLAKKHHPDATDGGDTQQFRLLVRAHKVLTTDETRAAYDARYQEYWSRKWQVVSEASHGTAFAEDAETRHKLLSLMYVQRRREMRMPGLGEYEMAKLLRTPVELVEFHLWYMREKGFVHRIETGQLAITALGVDDIERKHLHLAADRLLAVRGEGSAEAGTQASPAEPERIEDGRQAT
jgi:curved DNA-binding protein CbpA